MSFSTVGTTTKSNNNGVAASSNNGVVTPNNGLQKNAEIFPSGTLSKKNPLEELANKLGISVDQLSLLKNEDPSFLNKNFEEQQKIVQARFATQPEVVETEPENPQSPQAKIISALAQNFYEVGLKDSNGNVIQGFNANGAGSWAQLTDAQKAEFIQKVETELKNSKFVARLDKNIKELSKEIIKNEGEEVAQNIGNHFTNESLLEIKAATFSGVSVKDLRNMSEAEKATIIEKYLTENKDLTDYEKNRLSCDNEIKNNTIGYLKYLGYDIPKDSNIGAVYGYLDNLNLSYEGAEYWTLKRKSETSSLTQAEKARLEFLSKTFGTPSGKETLNEQKAHNLPKLDEKFAELQKKIDAGIKLSTEEQLQYDMLKQTLNSEETAELRKIELPKPQNEYQQEIYNQVEAFNKRFGHIGDSSRKAQLAKDFIERRTAGMTPEQKKEFIVNYLKFATKDGYAVELQRLYSVGNNAIDFSDSKEVYSLTAVNSDLLNPTQLESLRILTENMARSKNKREQRLAGNGYRTVAPGLETRGDDKLSSSWVNTGITVAENTKDSSVLISSTSLNMTIKDADLQLQNRNNIAASDVYNNDVAKFELDNLNRYHAQNRLPILDNVTEGNAEMTAYAAENGAVTKLAVKDQVEGFNLLNDRVNEFIDQGVLTTDSLKNLADQIKDCDRTNQLAMHEKIMDSKYTEVQEHAASNINKYDASVRADALAIVMEKGNQKAIENALNALQNSPECVQKEVAAEIIAKANKAAFKEAFANGNLTDSQISSLTRSEKRQYFNNLFSKATPAQKLEMLRKVPNGPQKQFVYTYIALYDGGLLTTMIKSGMGEELLSVCKDMGAQNRIANEMQRLGISDSEILGDLVNYVKTSGNESLLGKTENQKPVTNPITMDDEVESPKTGQRLFIKKA